MTRPSEDHVQIHRGLTGVYFDRTKASFIDGHEGKLLYRGYNIHDLAERSTFEETAYLLLHGDLPTSEELHQFEQELKAARAIPGAVVDVIHAVKHAHPMDVLRTAVSALAAFDPETGDNSIEATIRKGVRLTSQVATIVMAHEALRNGRKPVEPSTTLSHAANFLYMLTGQEPSAETTQIMDVDFILHAEHGPNASAFAAHVIASTGANLHAAIVGAIGALSGPAHGGAAENVMQMAIAIGNPSRAADYVRQLRAQGEAVMGFGHRVYRVEDPRARHLRDRVRGYSRERGEPRWYAILDAVEEAMKPYGRLGIHVNVDFFAGVLYYLSGFPPDLFVPIFAVGRIPGWTVQVVEQFEKNILIRPLAQYVGPMDREYVPIAERTSSAA